MRIWRSALALWWAVIAGALAPACGSSGVGGEVEIYVAPAHRDAVISLVESIPLPARIVAVDDPEAALSESSDADLRAALVIDQDCSECYRLERSESAMVVRAGDQLGLLYGLSHLFEEAGMRFYHPRKSFVPDRLYVERALAASGTFLEPERSRRGLHLHTIHPIESYYSFWEPSADNLIEAKRVVEWLLKGRGNYLQWVAMDDIILDPGKLPAWREHTAAIIDYAHQRGVEVGLGVQLFGSSNLQQGFDLIDFDEGEGDPETAITERLELLLDGIEIDVLSLSFGEFFGEDPQRFIDLVDLTYQVLQEVAPGTEMTVLVHVSSGGELEVEYQGETYLYYFLVQFADPAVVPWVHTTMYYNLFEDAGGAYLHDEFDEHREFLLDRLEQRLPVAYMPETAYWIAFDVSVPYYAPLYIRTRWLDLDRIREEMIFRGGADLDEHILFSTGWEWGYWQNDYTALRASFVLPGDWRDLIVDMVEPIDPTHGQLADAMIDITEAQAEHLIDNRLAAYLAGRDIGIDAGEKLGIVSQPDRPSFEEVVALDADGRAAFERDVLEPLADLRDRTEVAAATIASLDLPPRWGSEMTDAAQITALRAGFAHAVWSAALAQSAGQSFERHLMLADLLLAGAEAVVERRHGRMHDHRVELLVDENQNATIYQWGYLRQAHELCLWRRERVELDRLFELSREPIPPCLF